jgi:hypothetical protein
VIVIGIVAILLAVAATAVAFAGTGPAVRMSVASVDLTADPAAVFVAGGVTAAVLVVGLILLVLGIRRARGRRRKRRDLERRAHAGDSHTAAGLDTHDGPSTRGGSGS